VSKQDKIVTRCVMIWKMHVPWRDKRWDKTWTRRSRCKRRATHKPWSFRLLGCLTSCRMISMSYSRSTTTSLWRRNNRTRMSCRSRMKMICAILWKNLLLAKDLMRKNLQLLLLKMKSSRRFKIWNRKWDNKRLLKMQWMKLRFLSLRKMSWKHLRIRKRRSRDLNRCQKFPRMMQMKENTKNICNILTRCFRIRVWINLLTCHLTNRTHLMLTCKSLKVMKIMKSSCRKLYRMMLIMRLTARTTMMTKKQRK